ncbi:hypothetical protein ES702_04514 [subsurface metagenome]
MSQEEMINMMLQKMLPFKFDIKITLTHKDKEDLEFNLIGDIFQSKLQGEDRIFIALKPPERDE